MATLRTFTAINLPDPLVRKLDQLSRRHLEVPSLRPVAASALHITLNFVGDVEDRDTPGLCQEFSRALDGIGPFEIQLSGWGAFPNFTRPRVFWVGIDSGAEQLTEINQRFRDVIEDFGFMQDKKYHPHVTVARVQSRSVESDLVKRLQSTWETQQWPAFEATEVIVYNSILDRSGPTHIPLSTIRLSD